MKCLDASALQEFDAGRALRRLKTLSPGLNELLASPPCPVSPAQSLWSQMYPKLQPVILSEAALSQGTRQWINSSPRQTGDGDTAYACTNSLHL